MAEGNGPRAEILRSRDFIGWAVTAANGANVGTVSDILIDRRGQVRYLAVDPGFFKKAYLLPVEAMEWGEGSLQTSWTDAEVKRLPPYDSGVPLTAEVLNEMRTAFPRHYGDHAGTAFEPGEGPSVVPLKDAKDFRLAKGAPNLKGWNVYGADNEKVGTVHQMLVDPVAMKVRYLDVDLDDGVSGEPDRHVLVPIGYARLDADHDRVLVDEITSHDLRAIPAYRHGPLTRDFETSVRDSWRGGRRETHHEERGIHGEMREMRREDNVERGGPGPVSGGIRADAADDFYDGDLFDESKFWAARRATGLGGALGDIGADAGYPSDLGDRT